MRNKIKIKFSIFLGSILLLTIILISVTVLKGIQLYQKSQYEEYLAQQAQSANVYFLQSILSKKKKVPESFLTENGEVLAEEIELLTGQSIRLYNQKGVAMNKQRPQKEWKKLKEGLQVALKNKTAYLVVEDSLYYFAPLRIGQNQAGVIQFTYSLTSYLDFYHKMKNLLIAIGAGVFLLSFIIAYFYFGSFATSIIKLEKMVGRIREGFYETMILPRKDEIGRLSQGIHEMSEVLQKTWKEMEEEKEKLTLAVEKLSFLDQQQKKFIGHVTHEFKTPLTSIKAYLDLLEMYPDDQDLLKRAKDNIKDETDKLYEMVVKVLHLSSMDKYDFEYKIEKLDIKKELLEVVKRLKGKCDKFQIHLSLQLTEDEVAADRDSLRMILMNLLDNAIKYNVVGGSITLRNFRSGEDMMIEIADTGIGIPGERVDAIFQDFYTVDKDKAREKGGFGLGLSLARKQAELLGGTLSLVETNELGTVFQLVLPAAK